MRTTVKVELNQLNRKMQTIATRFPKAVAMAVNATRKRVITERNRDIRTVYNIKLKTLNDAITVGKVATESDPVTVISINSRPIGASHFSMKIPKQAGVKVKQRSSPTVQIKKGQTKQVRGYWGQRNAKKPGFSQNLWKRTGNLTSKGKDELDRFISINPAQFYKSKQGSDLITTAVKRELPKELMRSLRALRIDSIAQ